MLCTPGSRAQQVGLALGAQAGESRLADVLRAAGFSQVRRAAETPSTSSSKRDPDTAHTVRVGDARATLSLESRSG